MHSSGKTLRSIVEYCFFVSGVKAKYLGQLSHKIIDYTDNHIDYKAEKEHGCQWKIKPEIGFFHINITWQSAYKL
jgi:hypothetical protein